MVTATVTLILRRLVLAAVIAVASQVPLGALAWSQPATCAAADGQHHVALVVQHGDGSTVIRCVAFTGASVTGEQVLISAKVEYQTVSFGGLNDAVCQVDSEPATFPPGCWTSQSDFWALFVARAGGHWFPSSLGISSVVFHDGDMEGLRYEPQAQPVAPTVYGNCPVATPTPARTPTPTPTPTPTRTPNPTPRATGTTPNPTPAPSANPTAPASDEVLVAASQTDAGPTAQPADQSPGASAALPVATSANDAGDPPAGAPIALVLGLAVVAGLAGLAIARYRSSSPRQPR